ncbi:MAG: anthranilate phosphoribosyltransferase, partial [Gammaproteobacteria bacterium]|nr:anthranilate phosphoribosyltransferase [Gammaproteobacteria bacterium]
GLLVALRMKGEKVDEIAAGAAVMREFAAKIEIEKTHLLDTCGTGGDGKGLFNVSTAVAVVVAAAGGRVAKHGNRSLSSKSGSADVLEAAGVNIALSPQRVEECIAELGVGFLFAPAHHQATRHAAVPRRELGVRTLFNLLGPLTNPADAPHQLLGVFDKRWLEPMARVLKQLGSRHVMVVHADDGLDEVSIASATNVAELHEDEVKLYTITPEQYGIKRGDISSLVVDGPQQSLQVIRDVLAGRPGPARDIILLNAGAALYTADLAENIEGGIKLATHAIDTGFAAERLEQLTKFSNAE